MFNPANLRAQVVFMNASLWLNKLEQADPSYLLLVMLAGTIVLAGILHRIGLIAAVLRAHRPCCERSHPGRASCSGSAC